ncbi:MAG: prepilin-type N-terminal cleavage/methylation domain-containing protein [Bacilli bacterium]|jgi:prepilin-type N-terminal cleavage/methylation domain-containing protein
MNKKGFTLIEMMTVIIILLLLATIVLVGVSKAFKAIKMNAYYMLTNEFEAAAREYIKLDKNKLKGLSKATPILEIELGDLININNLKEPLIDPRDDSVIPLNKKVLVILTENNQIQYCYEDNDCPNPIE